MFRPFQQLAIFGILGILLLIAGCYAPYYANRAAGGGTDAAVGEEHDVPYDVHDAYLLTQDALRSEGVLFEVKPDNKLLTLWQNADEQKGVLGSLVGLKPQYRYEITVVPLGDRSSRIIVNVRTQDMGDQNLAKYQSTSRLNLFGKIDQIAAATPPTSGTPKEGGVNYALLPNEDLKGLAQRVTGDQNNWRKIAQDNGVSSASGANGLQSIWVRNTLLPASRNTDSP
jgi:hypothetical protein